MDDDHDALLKRLNEHGKRFLDSFPANPAPSHKRRRVSVTHESTFPSVQDSENWDDEWDGIEPKDQPRLANSMMPSSEQIVVFSATGGSSRTVVSKAAKKAFMSSKITKLGDTHPTAGPSEQPSEGNPIDDEDDRTNLQNDKILHELVHTKLLSGSLNPEVYLKPAHRRKALAGRVLELAGKAKLGKGEKLIREDERNRAAKRIRDGMADKQKTRRKQNLEEAKDLGNYHPIIKKQFESEDSKRRPKRERGLSMGVGRFKGGMLKLRREDELSIQGKTGGDQRRHNPHQRRK